MNLSNYCIYKTTGWDRNTYHAGLGNRVGEQNEEDTQHRADLDGEAAWLALKPEERGGEVGERLENRSSQ